MQAFLNLAQLALAMVTMALMIALAPRLRRARAKTPEHHPDPTSGFRDPCR